MRTVLREDAIFRGWKKKKKREKEKSKLHFYFFFISFLFFLEKEYRFFSRDSFDIIIIIIIDRTYYR